MYVIGERINGMFENVKQAIRAKDAAVIQDLAKRQMAAGAGAGCQRRPGRQRRQRSDAVAG